MNLIRSIHEDCSSYWNHMNSSLRSNLRRLSESLCFVSLRGPTFKRCSFQHVVMETKESRVVIFGEQHHQPSILKAQLCLLEGMASQAKQENSHLVLVLEMFNFQQQNLLDAYEKHEIDLNELEGRYKGTEGFSILNHYGFLLHAARHFGIKVIGGFVPRHLGRAMIDNGEEHTLQLIHELGGPAADFYVKGTEAHYRYFQGLISGNMGELVEKYRRIFPSQILKDSFFAYTVTKLIETSQDIRVLGMCGSGHMDYGFGIPERIPSHISKLLITSRMKDDAIEPDIANIVYQY